MDYEKTCKEFIDGLSRINSEFEEYDRPELEADINAGYDEEFNKGYIRGFLDCYYKVMHVIENMREI